MAKRNAKRKEKRRLACLAQRESNSNEVFQVGFISSSSIKKERDIVQVNGIVFHYYETIILKPPFKT